MSNVIGIMGESGSGKTTSLRNLDPSSTLIIDCDGKGLSWRGWRNQYGKEHRNYWRCDDQSKIVSFMKVVNTNEDYANIKVLVVDTLNGIMVADEFRRKDEKGYDKWSDLAWAVWDIVNYALTMRDDLTVVFTAHTQTERDDSGYMFTRIKTSGKKLDKLSIESKLSTVLLAKTVDGKHVFETQANNSTAKSPMGCFERVIDNDMQAVIQELRDYEGMTPLSDSKQSKQAQKTKE